MRKIRKKEHIEHKKRYVLVDTIGSFFLIFDRQRQELDYCIEFNWIVWDSEWYINGDDIDRDSHWVDLEWDIFYIDSYKKLW